MSLNRRDHAGHHILTSEQTLCFRLETRPGTGREFTQQLAIEARVNSQTLGDGQHDLSVGDGRADLVGNVQRGQQRALLVAGWAGGHRRAAMVGCLQEKATNISCLQPGQRTRANPSCRSPHLRKAATDCSTIGRQ